MDSPNLNIENLNLNSFHTGTELHTAAVNGDKQAIERILKEHGDVSMLNKGDKFGRTALLYTLFGEWFECAEILVRRGADLLQVDSDRRNLLHWAAYLNRPTFLKLFLENLDPNLECNYGDKDGRTALHYAAIQTNAKCLRLLLKRSMLNKRNLNITDNEQMTALHWSVFYNRLENFKMLLREGAETSKRDAQGRCLLHMAVLNPTADSLRIVRILLKHNRHFSIQFDCDKHTALHLAVANGNQELVRELCLAEESALDNLDNLSRSVLHYATLKNDIEIFNILAAAGVSPHHVDSTGAGVLHYAAKNNCVTIVKRFLECFKNFEDITDIQGRTALMWAASEGSYDVLKLMLKHHLGYFNIHASDEQGLTALHFACFAGHTKCVELLIEMSADITLPDQLGQTALFKACEQGHCDIIEILMGKRSQHKGRHSNDNNVPVSDNDGDQVVSRQEMSKDNSSAMGTHMFSIDEETVLTQNITKNLFSEFSCEKLDGIEELEDENGCTPLHFAAHAGHTNVCSWLLNLGMIPGKKDVQGRTALHGAAFNGHTECMALILSHDKSLANDRDNDGYSVLHHAVINGQLEAVKLLVSEPYLAFLNYRVNSTDWTPLDFAMAADHQDVTQFLMDNGALTIAWLQDVAADKIKKFLRRLVVRKQEATVKPLIERHKQVTISKKETLRNCKREITRNDSICNVANDEVTSDEVVKCNSADAVNRDIISMTDCAISCCENIVAEINSDNKRTQRENRQKGNFGEIRTNFNENFDKSLCTTDEDCFLSTFAGDSEVCDNTKHLLLLDACYYGDLAGVLKLLQEKLEVNYRDENGCTALHFAAGQGYTEICESLLENQADAKMRDMNGRTALHNAALAGNKNVISMLLRYEKAVTLYLDRNHRSPLHYAASMGNLDSVKLLCHNSQVQNAYAKPVPLSALDCAILGRHNDVIRYLTTQGIQPSGLLDQAARVVQTNFRKWLNRKGLDFRGKTKKYLVKDLPDCVNTSKDGQIRKERIKNVQNAVTNSNTTSQNCAEKLETECDERTTGNTLESCQAGRTTMTCAKSLSRKSSGIQTKATYCPSKINRKSWDNDRAGRLSENFPKGINNTYIEKEQSSRTIKLATCSKRANSASATTSTFAQSNIANLSRAPYRAILLGGEKERILNLRNNWERIAILRRKKQAALTIQNSFRRYLASKRKTSNKHTNEVMENKSSKLRYPTDSSKAKETRIIQSNTDQVMRQHTVETSSGVYSNETTQPKYQYKSTFPFLSPRSNSGSSSNRSRGDPSAIQSPTNRRLDVPMSQKPSSTSSNWSHGNSSVIQSTGNRRPIPSHSNERLVSTKIVSPKSSSTSLNRSHSNASAKHGNRRNILKHAKVAPSLTKNELVSQWLSEGFVSSHSIDTKSVDAKNGQVVHEKSNSERVSRQRTASSQTARIRRDSMIKNPYGSPAVNSYNFALDTYHPLASRRGRKDNAFPFTTSSRIRPNSMKRVDIGWVRTSDLVPGIDPSEP